MPELGDKAAQDSGLVHQGQGGQGTLAPRQHVQEGLGRLRVAPQLRSDQRQGPGDQGEGVRVQVHVAPVGDDEQADEVDGIALEGLRPVDGESTAVLGEALDVQWLARAAPGAQEAGKALRLLLGLVGLQLGAELAGQDPDLAGDQEIAAHEPFDRRRVVAVLPRAVEIAHPPGDLGLQVEAQPLLRPAGDEVQAAAHRPQEIEGADEGPHLPPVEHVQAQGLVGRVQGVQVLGDPEQGVEIPEPPCPP